MIPDLISCFLQFIAKIGDGFAKIQQLLCSIEIATNDSDSREFTFE